MNEEVRSIESAIILGVGTPNICASGEKTMCAILLSEMGLFRVYPIPGGLAFPVWSKIKATIKRPKTDSREESWSLIDFEILGRIKNASEKRAILDRCILKSGVDDPLDFQNSEKKSIAIVKPKMVGGQIDQRDAREDSDWVHTQDMAWTKPFINWTSEQGGSHKSHLVSREAYETIRRNPDSPWDLFRNLNLGSRDWDFWLIMGNMKNRRNVWCAVHLHRLKKTSGLSIPLYCDLTSGRKEDWPYSMQQDGNVPSAEGQLLMFTT